VAVGPEVTVHATLRGEAVLVQQGNVFGAAFHPELTTDTFVHAMAFATHRSE
jgi:glutamine amidotransferase PdxT